MAWAALGAVLAASVGAFAEKWLLLALCAAMIPVTAFLFHRRNTCFLLPMFAFLVLIRMICLPMSIPEESRIGAFLIRVRGGLQSTAEILFRNEAAAAKGILLGDTSGLSAAEHLRYANSGLLHIFAVSGLHVTLLSEAFGRMIRPQNRWVSVSLLAVFMLVFSAVTGFSASVLRAAFMLLAIRIARARDRQTDMPSALCFALAMTVLFEPNSMVRAGFQLSFSAAFGMIVLGRIFHKPFDNRFPSAKMPSALTASAAATVGMLPVMAYHFGGLAWIAIPLSVLLIPTMPIVLIFGFFAILLYGILPHLATLLSYPAYGAIRFLSMVTQLLDVPLMRLPKPHPIAIVLYYCALLLCSGLNYANRKRPPLLGLGMLIVSILLWFLW